MCEWKKLAGSIGGEMSRRVSTYKWSPAGYSVTIAIDIYEYADGKFSSTTSKLVKTPTEASPNSSNVLSDSEEAALKDAICCLSAFMVEGETTFLANPRY